MQIGSRVDGSYVVPYQNNSKVMQGAQYAKTESEHSGQENFVSVDSREVYKPWIPMGTKIRETLAGQPVFLEETEEIIGNIQEEAKRIEIASGEEGVARLEHGIKKIVRTVNPEDGKEYVTYFTKHNICCKWMEGDKEVSWTMDITEEQYALIDKYFDGYNSGNEEEQLWYSGDEFGMVSSKEYWLGFFEGAEVSDENYMEAIRGQIEEMQEKIENGEINETFQIGGQSFTVEEWNEFLEKFDSIQEVLEALMKERHAEKDKQQSVKEEDAVGQNVLDMIISESTLCTYPASDTNGEEIRYITCYTEEGIFCKKAGLTDGYEWSIPFESKEQYNKVMEFIRQFPSDWNMRFAAHENFWKDFLNDEIDMEGFMEFINGTNKGVPDFSVTEGESMYVDKEKVQWAKYTNPLGARFYTAEEMHQMQMEIIAANEANLTKMTTSYGEIYKLNHPDYNGERIFCEYPGGPLYTADEIGRLKWEQFLTEMDMTEEEMHQKREEWRAAVGYVEKVDSTEDISTESKIIETKSSEIKVSNFKEYETPNYQFIPEPDIGSGGMRILKNGQSVAVFSVDDLKIRVDESTGTRVLISEIGGYNGIWYDAIPVDAELESGLTEAIGVDDIPEIGLEGYYIGTHARTGIQYVMRPGDEGRGGKVLLKNEADVARYNALAEEYYKRYSNLINSPEEGKIWASFEIVGMAERTSTGIIRIGFDSVSYNDNFDYKKNWTVMFAEETWEMLNDWLKENGEYMKELHEFGFWRDVFNRIGGSYERIWSDEELKQGYLNN